MRTKNPKAEHPKEAIDELLKLAQQTTSIKQKNRYDAVILYLKDYSRDEIAEILHTPKRTVSYHIHTYFTKGIDALLIKKQPGAKKKTYGRTGTRGI